MEEKKEERVNSNGLILDVDQNPKKAGTWIILAIQHVLAMFVACVTVPMLVLLSYKLHKQIFTYISIKASKCSRLLQQLANTLRNL